MLLNCDMGESFGNYTIGSDSEAMAYVDMANIACGMHASDPDVMNYTVSLAAQYDVTVGAHPGYRDLQGFGRREMNVSPLEVENLILYQVGAITPFCRKHNARLEYIKPHGALYNTMMREPAILEAVMSAASRTGMKLIILATSNWQEHKRLAERFNIELLLEAFVDRGYEDDGSLVHRSRDRAFLDKAAMIDRVERLLNNIPIRSVNNTPLHFPIDTLCVHGDGDGVSVIKQLRAVINRYGQ